MAPIDADSTERVSLHELPRPSGIGRDPRGVLTCGGRSIEELLHEAGVGTPAYLYDLDAIGATARALAGTLGPDGLCAYAIKANSSAPIVRRIIAEGCGVDVVSGGELRVAIACGAAPSTIVYSGVAKRDDELDLAIATGIRAVHVESVEEIDRIAARAKTARRGVPIAIRVNPALEVDTHAFVATGHDEAKFGVSRADLPRALAAIARAKELRLVGLSAHVGSQLMEVAPYAETVRVLAEIASGLRGRHRLEYLDPGGGYGTAYRADEHALAPTEFVLAARAAMRAHGVGDLHLVIEPGRALVAAHGVLVTRVVQEKRSGDRRWIFLDAGMNDLIRPALYQAHHRIEPLAASPDAAFVEWRVAGPVCESSDDFGAHPLPDPAPAIVAIRDVGAYGRSMASTYNLRPNAAEIFVELGRVVAVRPAPSIDALVVGEMTVVSAAQ